MTSKVVLGAAAVGAATVLWAGGPAASAPQPAVAVGAQAEVPPEPAGEQAQPRQVRSGGEPPVVQGQQQRTSTNAQSDTPPTPD
jgi:hypothetical protein